eukprot:1999636-Rhodomonas_salina.1
MQIAEDSVLPGYRLGMQRGMPRFWGLYPGTTTTSTTRPGPTAWEAYPGNPRSGGTRGTARQDHAGLVHGSRLSTL